MKRVLVIFLLIVIAGGGGYFVLHSRVDVDSVFKIGQTGRVSGVVRYGPTNPLGGFCSSPSAQTTVIFTNQSGQSYETVTDAWGKYSVSLPTGEYWVGYKTGSRITYDMKDKGKQGFNTDISVSVNKTVVFDGCFDTGIR